VICDRFETAVVPFPFSDMPVEKRRPALVLSSRTFNEESGETIMAMITTAKGSSWPSDISVRDIVSAGLVTNCFIRWKVMTLPNSMILRRLGKLSEIDTAACRTRFDTIFS
jgi:mRNA interferase MazF